MWFHLLAKIMIGWNKLLLEQKKDFGGISYTAHGTHITPPPYSLLLLLCLFKVKLG